MIVMYTIPSVLHCILVMCNVHSCKQPRANPCIAVHALLTAHCATRFGPYGCQLLET
jgi:hypothetical protein